jgi:hypothetical protein
LEDPRIKQLRQLLDEARSLQHHATSLVMEITDQIQRSIFMHDDRASRRHRQAERRKKPRDPRAR